MQRWLILSILFLFGCASTQGPQHLAAHDQTEREADLDVAALEEAPAASALAGRAAPKTKAMQVKDVAVSPTQPNPYQGRKRLVHYNGYAQVRVTQPELSVVDAIALAEKSGGMVEQRTGSTVTLRVPVEKFRALFDALLKLGDVVSQSVTAQDVTDTFVEIELRLKTLKATRDRLVDLLALTKKEAEKLRLLQEIKRLTEQIDQLELQAKTLQSLADFSRITLEFVPRGAVIEHGEQEPIAAFRWIWRLSPFRRDVALEGDTLELDAPKNMVVLDRDDLWAAESADGAAMWASLQENEPRGDAQFWLEAIKQRLGPTYASADVQSVGRYVLLRLVDGSQNAYRYQIALRVDDDEIEVIEIYFPTAEHEARHGEGVRAVLQGGVS